MKIFATREAEQFLKTGAKEFRYDRSISLTPMARDLLTEGGVKVVFDAGAAAPCPHAAPASAAPQGTPPSGERLRLFSCPEAERVKREICEIGKRLWMREYIDANGGNISYRIGPDEFLCTPTLVSKGFMTPDMICMVDGKGNQLAGTYKRTSEFTTHMAIYNSTADAKAVVHAHPVHATAFAISGVEPPACLIPEIEVFVGKVPIAPYRTPGTQELAEVLAPLAAKHQSIMMGNHGLICWGASIEDAYFKMEITDAYCRTIIVAMHIPSPGTSIPCDSMADLLKLKEKLGLPDPRHGLQTAQLCEIDPWDKIKDHPMGCCSAPESANPAIMTNAELENSVQRITDEILAKLPRG